MMPPPRNLVRIALITAAILCIPWAGMLFSDGVTWTVVDFVVAGALVFGAGLLFDLVARRAGNNVAYRVAAGIACATALILVWVNLAVGLIGSEDHPADLLYLGVLAVGGLGAILARLRPLGMARALFATAIAQTVVPVLAVLIWKPRVINGGDVSGLIGVLFLNSIFVLLFVASAALFRRAGTMPGLSTR